MSIHTLQIQRPWNVITPIVTRYMDEEYVNLFFETGTLRLSSFAKFAKHTDELRQDREEGRSFLVGTSPGGPSVSALTHHGHRSFVLCTSVLDSDSLQSEFATTARFQILDTIAFGATVAQAVPSFTSGLEGLCLYQDSRMITRDVGALDLEQLKTDPNSLETLSRHVFQIGGAEVFFIKSTKYAGQSEYRFIWNVSSDIEEFIDVKVPDAVQYCRRVA